MEKWGKREFANISPGGNEEFSKPRTAVTVAIIDYTPVTPLLGVIHLAQSKGEIHGCDQAVRLKYGQG